MAHPRMYTDEDPFLAEVREICLALPEATEVEAWGRPTFRAKKIFALFTGDEAHPYALTLKPDADEQVALVQDPRFYAPPYWGPFGWLSLDLTAAPVDWTEVAELVETSYRQIALKRMLAVLDARPT
jgi:predicted DNA-binding protein (MmcQ/YjbR family)